MPGSSRQQVAAIVAAGLAGADKQVAVHMSNGFRSGTRQSTTTRLVQHYIYCTCESVAAAVAVDAVTGLDPLGRIVQHQAPFFLYFQQQAAQVPDTLLLPTAGTSGPRHNSSSTTAGTSVPRHPPSAPNSMHFRSQTLVPAQPHWPRDHAQQGPTADTLRRDILR
jgi:hypothetical protein